MMRLTAVVAMFTDLGEPQLTAWIERGWVRPGLPGVEPEFDDMDETIPLVLSLLDQVYELRAGLRSVLRAVDAQPDPVREAIRAAID
jgi:chaperone modulatory protein CbpM